MRINFNEPRFGEEEKREVEKVLDISYVNEGPKTKELEEMFKDYLGVKHVILTTNATAALYLAVKADALIKKIEDFEVIVPDMTMIATATAVGWAGGKVVPVDVDKNRMTINPEEIEKKITSKTTAIIPVHIIGRSVNMDELREIARKHNMTIIEDAAGALGSRNERGYLGTFGKVGCFSLQSNKIITSGQGGVIVTNDDEYFETMRRLRDFGRMSNKEHLHEVEGYNLKYSDLAAALAVAQFRRIEDRKDMLMQQRKTYEKELLGINEIQFPRIDMEKGEIPLWIDVFAENRDALIQHLNESEIYPRPCWPAIHRNPPYQHTGSDNDFPNASYLSDNVIFRSLKTF